VTTLVLELNIQLALSLIDHFVFTPLHIAPIVVRELMTDRALDQTQHIGVATYVQCDREETHLGERSPRERAAPPLPFQTCIAKTLAKLATQTTVNDNRLPDTAIVNAKFHERWVAEPECGPLLPYASAGGMVKPESRKLNGLVRGR